MSFCDELLFFLSTMKSALLEIERVPHSCFYTCSYNGDSRVTSFVNHFSVTMMHMCVTASDPTPRIGPSSTAGKLASLHPLTTLTCFTESSEALLNDSVLNH